MLDLANLMYGPIGDLLDDDLLAIEGRALTRALAPPPVTDLVNAQFLQTASLPAVLRELSLVARLLVAMVDGELELDVGRVETLRNILKSQIECA